MTRKTQMEFYNMKKQIAIHISKRILLEEKEKGNIYVPILDGDKMLEVVKFSLEAVEKLTKIAKGQNLYELPYSTIIRRIMEQINYCGPFYPRKKTLNLGKFKVNSKKEISAILTQNVVDVVELTTGYLITEQSERTLLVPAHMSDEDVMELVMEIIKSREALKNVTNGTSVFEQDQQLLMNTIIVQIIDYIPQVTPNITENAEEKTIHTEVKPADVKKKVKKGKSSFRRLFNYFSPRVSRWQKLN